jgi:hypothetical protein
MARTIIGGYTGYNFRDHDLVFDKLSRLYEVAGFLKANGRPDFKKISYKSGVPIGTLLRWDGRLVRKPQHAGVKAVVEGLGGRYEIRYGEMVIARAPEITRKDVLARRAREKMERAKRRSAMKKVGRGPLKKAA